MRESLTKRRLPEAAVRAFVEDALGKAVMACTELKDGFFNTAFALTLECGQRVVLKVAPPPAVPVLRDEARLMDNEAAALRAAASFGLPAPRLLAAFDAATPLGSPSLLMAFVEGTPFERLQPQLDAVQVATVYLQLGALVRQMHAQTAAAYGRLIEPYATWREAFGVMVQNLVRDAQDTQALPLPLLAALEDRVRRDEAALAEVTTPAFLHRDLWFGNLFVQGDALRLTCLIDWERAQWGDPLLDLVFGFMEGPSAYAAGRGAFDEGYGRDGILSPAEQARTTLYTAYFQAILPVEGRFRGYGSEASAQKALAALKKTLGGRFA